MTYKKKLIEVALPLVAISRESARQKTMGQAPHPQNLHRWWARRPLAAARAVLWASLVDDPSSRPDEFPTEELQQAERERLFRILERLVPWEASNDESTLSDARREIERSCGDKLPTIVDPFAGGGAIPLEGLRLGLPTAAGDLNPVAVLIQKAMLEVPSLFAGQAPVHPDAAGQRAIWTGATGLAADVNAYGQAVRTAAEHEIGHMYPGVDIEGSDSTGTPLVWVWARTVKSPDPAWPGHVPLVRSWLLAKKPRQPVYYVQPRIDMEAKTISYAVTSGGVPPEATVGRGKAVCLATGTAIPLEYIDEEASHGRLGVELLAVVADVARSRKYLTPDASQRRAIAAVPSRDALAADADLPTEGTRGTFAGNAQGRYYGFFEFKDYFTDRQLVALSTFSRVIREIRQKVEHDAVQAGYAPDGVRLRDRGNGATAYADAVVTYLAFVLDKCADNWSSLCSWHLQNEQVKQTFALQSVQMTWDFVEVNPFSGRMASWDSMLAGVSRSIPTLASAGRASVEQRDAVARVKEVGASVLATDPPYYDNIAYADLSDFFYVWLKRNLREVWPDELATVLTPKVEELIANRYRAGSVAAAQAHFESGIRDVFVAAAANADPRFPATIFYAFKATESTDDGVTSTGWETFLTGLLESGYAVTATWPMRTEMIIGIKAAKSMLASSVVLACRPREVTAPLATRGEFIAALRSEMAPAVRLLQVENIAPVDLAQSAMGPGIAIFSRYAKVVEADGTPMTVRAALGLINETLSEILSGEESEFDADTRFALTWFEQYGHNPGPFGDADLLARAKDTTVAGVAQAGVVVNRDGKVRLVERAALPDDWDPALDDRLTVWESTQHLIRALESSELDAAALARRLGTGFGDRSRQLAYLLFGVCEKRKWMDEAGAYNMLVTAWPEISRLASAEPAIEAPERLF